MKTREEALSLFKKYNESESLLRHALAVEGVMRHFSKIYQEDENHWGIVGLLHDLDWEKYPDQHCEKCQEILQAEGYSEEVIRAIVSHGWQICSDVKPEAVMEKVLYSIDELTGLITACVLMRPSKSILDMTAKSVKNKWKDKRFAAGVNRQVIENGANELGMPLDQLITETIEGMKVVADDIGLNG